MRVAFACGPLLLLLVASAAFAEEPPITRLPEIRVTARSPDVLPSGSTPNRVDTLSGGEITVTKPSVLPDALERVPGVTLQNELGTRFQPNLSVRGFTVSSVTGVPQD